MASVDKAAIGWTIGIVAAAIGIAFAGSSGQDLNVEVSLVGSSEPPLDVETAKDAFSDVAEKIKSQAEVREEAMKEQMQMGSESESSVSLSEATVTTEPVAPAGPQTVIVTVPAGTSVPGCEETNECYLPPSVSINAGDTVSWDNVDTAAHTVTSGTPANGPDGKFDSSLLMGGATFEVTFDESGSYDYFCMVHPWMVGDVQVN
ncbi:MAG: plastocyanin/azurin family copper-binding protein [Nitrosopumilaceae archaeon]